MSCNSNLEFRKIKSLDFLYEVNENGTIFRNAKSKKQLAIKLDMHHSKVGYYAVWVNIKGVCKRVMIHKAVAECWLGDKPEGMEIDHIDRNPHNNHFSNLRYVTHSEQMKNRQLGDHVIEQAKKNCLDYCLKYVAKPVMIRRAGEGWLEFRSMAKCAEYLAECYGKKSEHMRSKLKKRRHKIYDHDVQYFLNAQTGHVGSTEQGTVESKYLVGTLDRFNNAKRREVGDRVKHIGV